MSSCFALWSTFYALTPFVRGSERGGGGGLRIGRYERKQFRLRMFCLFSGLCRAAFGDAVNNGLPPG